MTHVDLAYLGRSQVTAHGDAQQVSLAPNLRREAVAFDAELRQPLRFREAMSALHAIVVCDQRVAKPDRTAYRAYLAAERQREATIATGVAREALRKSDAELGITPEMVKAARTAARRYWQLRDRYNAYLRHEDPTLWRMLTPCDPIVTVADDVCLFEGFSVDESAYGCLSTRRDDAFGKSEQLQLGTTNVDYSQALYEQFQELRSYKATRLQVDPQGFTVRTEGHPDYREEKIELPDGWLRGLMQVQVAAGMPGTRVELPRETVYAVLAFLRRHRERSGPRALRFELVEGQPVALVLEPFDVRIVAHGSVYRGPSVEPIRIWGRRRLAVLERALPLAERVSVHLLGTGLPSFWLVHMGEMTLTLGLSGWTSNDWTRGSALDQLRPPQAPGADVLAITAGILQQRRALSRAELLRLTHLGKAELAAALDHLAFAGQTLYDLDAGVQRWRAILPGHANDLAVPRNPEAEAAAQLRAQVERREQISPQRSFVAGKVGGTPCECVVDSDGQLSRGKCLCGHHRRFGLRNGACRHLLALRASAVADAIPADSWTTRAERWFSS